MTEEKSLGLSGNPMLSDLASTASTPAYGPTCSYLSVFTFEFPIRDAVYIILMVRTTAMLYACVRL
jgi:hypothetical protein